MSQPVNVDPDNLPIDNPVNYIYVDQHRHCHVILTSPIIKNMNILVRRFTVYLMLPCYRLAVWLVPLTLVTLIKVCKRPYLGLLYGRIKKVTTCGLNPICKTHHVFKCKVS